MSARLFARRVGLIMIALVLSSVLLRSQLASALVTRGDDLVFWGNERAALAKYEIAVRIDPSSAAAADRFAFTAIRMHQPALLRRAVRFIDIALAPRASDPMLGLDRALCLHALGSYAEAAAAFSAVGVRTRDARALMFAALDLERIHRGAEARSLLKSAVALDPGFMPARHDLLRSEE